MRNRKFYDVMVYCSFGEELITFACLKNLEPLIISEAGLTTLLLFFHNLLLIVTQKAFE